MLVHAEVSIQALECCQYLVLKDILPVLPFRGGLFVRRGLLTPRRGPDDEDEEFFDPLPVVPLLLLAEGARGNVVKRVPLLDGELEQMAYC